MLVAISGKAGSGKDTAADYLVRKKYFTKISLADPIKRICGEIYGFSYEQLFGPSEMRSKPDERYPTSDGEYLTVRKAAQKVGTDCFRSLYEDTWVNYLLKTIKQLQSNRYLKYSPDKGIYEDLDVFDFIGKNKNIVTADVRFINEVDLLKKEKAYLIRIVKDSAGLNGESGSHLSETEQNSIPDNKFDDIIENNGTLEELYEKIDKVVEKYQFLKAY